MSSRPSVAIVVPWGGDLAQAPVGAALGRLQLAAGDELIVVLNGAARALEGLPEGARLELACARRSSYYARNVGARRSQAPWLLFVDADCEPCEELLDRYFEPAPGERCGALAGGVLPAPAAGGLIDRYSRSRGLLDQSAFLAREQPFAATANLLVRRSAFEQLDGFAEVRSGGDVDFCWRLAEAGWELGARPRAAVRHRHRERLAALLRQRARYGAGAAWLAQRHPGARPRARPLRGLAAALAAAVAAGARGRLEESAFGLIDALGYAAHALGERRSNEPQPASDGLGPAA